MAEAQASLTKAHENVAGAESELAQRRYNSCARGAYYACFHAAIAALLQAGIVPLTPERLWGHAQVQAHCVGQLIQRQKRYAASLRRTLTDLLALRHHADSRAASVSQQEARQAVRRVGACVEAVTVAVGRAGDPA